MDCAQTVNPYASAKSRQEIEAPTEHVPSSTGGREPTDSNRIKPQRLWPRNRGTVLGPNAKVRAAQKLPDAVQYLQGSRGTQSEHRRKISTFRAWPSLLHSEPIEHPTNSVCHLPTSLGPLQSPTKVDHHDRQMQMIINRAPRFVSERIFDRIYIFLYPREWVKSAVSFHHPKCWTGKLLYFAVFQNEP